MTAFSLLLACLAGGFAPAPDGPALAVYITCEVPLELVITAAAEPEPQTVWLGVDCSTGAPPFTVSLPDDVLIGECQGGAAP